MVSTLDAIVADAVDTLFERCFDLGHPLKARTPCLQWDRHVRWIRAIREPERRSLRTEIDSSSCNLRAYPGFLRTGAALTTRGRRRVPA